MLICSHNAKLMSALEEICEQTRYRSNRDSGLFDDLNSILNSDKCSGGFIQAVSYLYSTLNVFRCSTVVNEMKDEYLRALIKSRNNDQSICLRIIS